MDNLIPIILARITFHGEYKESNGWETWRLGKWFVHQTAKWQTIGTIDNHIVRVVQRYKMED